MLRRFLLLLCIQGWGAAIMAQSPTLPVPRNIQKALDKNTRSSSGQPGSAYWQNTAAYDIQVKFDPATRRISGTEEVTYTNHSPDALGSILFKIYPNIYQKGAIRLMPIEPNDVTDGVQFARFAVNGIAHAVDSLAVDGTNLRVRIPSLGQGQTVHFSIAYAFTLNEKSHIRTGEIDQGAWFLAYFFPRVAVYDDLDGWNQHPYLGTQEFYNDFCDFNLAITVPRDHVVWATGDLTNCAEVLSPKYCQRLAQAERSNGITDVIDSTDLKTGGITTPNAENTFRFSAKNVTDVAVAISNHYVWKASSLVVDAATGRRTRVDAVFNTRHRDYFEVVDFARKTVESMSFRFPKWPYPYAHETVFDGLDQMEYPMMVNDNPLEDRAEAIELTDHEIFHTLFPFYMGTNETKYGWMDEGWATIGEWLITPMIDSSIIDTYSIGNYEKAAGTEIDLPIMTPTTQLFGGAMSINSYPKPALGYLYIKDLLGDDLFFKGLHYYIQTWQGKHPMPLDFFNCMNAGTGRNLNWFWKRWFFDGGVPDLGIAPVSKAVNDRKEKSVTIENMGGKPVPVDLEILYFDNSVEKIHRPIDVWEKGDKQTTIKWTSTKRIMSITLKNAFVPDVNRDDNVLQLGE